LISTDITKGIPSNPTISMNCIEPTTDEDIEDIVAEVLQGKQRIISYPHTGQYGPDGTGRSACGLAALNCARILLKLHEERNVDDGVKGTLPMFSRPAMEVNSFPVT